MSDEHFTRILDFDNVLNMRDFGGYEGEFGRLKTGKLFRSAHLSNASETDLSRLHDLNIGLIVDLRYLAERERQPNRWPESRPAKTLAFDASFTGTAPHEVFMEKQLNHADDARGYMLGNYAERPHQDGFKKVSRDAILHMVETGDGALIHCAAGKDRTGTLVALIQSLLGVNEQDIHDDYMLTMQAVDVESYLEPASKMIGEKYGREYTPDMLRPMFGVEPDYLTAMFKKMGNPADYAKKQLGLSQADLEKLKSIYIA